MLVIGRRLGEAIVIDGEVEVQVTEISGSRVKLGILAPRSCKVQRKEVHLAAEHNRAAVLPAAAALSSLALQALTGRKAKEENEPSPYTGSV